MMKGTLIYSMLLFLVAFNAKATDYYVATTGSDSYSGTSIETPFATVTKAISEAYSGDVIYVREGTYSYTSKISLSRSGTETNPITFQAYQDEKPVIDFSGMSLSSSNRGFSLGGDYWVIKGLRIEKAGDNGMHISGNNNTVENCVFFANRDTGLQLGNGAANNNIINCDSYGNADPSDYGDADGFACKIDVGTGNYFYGCRAWLNVDDGWDGYMKSDTQPQTTLENCWTWMNGYFLDGTDGGSSANGNGFKVGGSDSKDLDHHFTLINCVAFDNKSKGFDQNNNTGNMKFYNCTGFRNEGKNFSIPRTLNSGNTAEVKNCISLNGDLSLGSFVEQATNTWSSGFSVSTSDFVSIDTTGVSGDRNADGSLPDLDVFKLVEESDLIDAGTDLGYDFNGSAPDLGAFESDYSTGIFSTKNDNIYNIDILNNPVGSSLKLRLQNEEGLHEVNLQVIAISGSIVLQKQMSFYGGTELVTVDVSSLNKGMYILSVSSSKGTESYRFVKK